MSDKDVDRNTEHKRRRFPRPPRELVKRVIRGAADAAMWYVLVNDGAAPTTPVETALAVALRFVRVLVS